MQLAQEKGVTLLGLNHKDEPENARRFLGGMGNPYAKVGVDSSGRTSLDFGVYGVPETFAIDAEGRIVAKHVGALTMADAQELLRKAAGNPIGGDHGRPRPAASFRRRVPRSRRSRAGEAISAPS